MRDVTINESSESGGPCISIPLKQGDERRGTATRRHRRTVLFRFAGAGRGNFIDFERDSGALFFFFFFLLHRVIGDSRRQKTRGFPDSGEIKIRTGCLLFRASATRAIVLNSALFVLPERGGEGGCFSLRRG